MSDEVAAAVEFSFTAMTADIVSAYITNNHVQVGELPNLIVSVHASLTGLGNQVPTVSPEVEKPTPAQVRKSVTPDALISFEDGKSYKTLRRHLTLRGLTPEAYRAKWGLPADYPMTTANYSAQRSALAHSLGLGQKRTKATSEVSEAPEAASKTRGRKKAAETA
ncbi:MucR family transcriptional regulator [Methylobacterium sp. WL119]|uniref:MucR family transcriptional regulator n=1 Tax=unclassified Methylobacterium TaxID=2615210 RepID=UPI0011C7AC03|nr:MULTISPECIES: MucR family transcriptional regulator [unclassified Methylobacterium]TXN24949.1 MucR family transcriptional regulator [Methylobacterium sp. WL93]TXN43739.1 MucR family transcriptional regulator [Methylobacterium sp. WL119]